MGYGRKFQPDSRQQRLKDRDADYSLRHRAYSRTRQSNKVFTFLRHETRLDPPDCRDELRAVEEKKSSQHNRQNKLEGSHAGATRKCENRTGQGLELGSWLTQCGPYICRGLVPPTVKLRTDDRPILYALRRRWNSEGALPELPGESLQTVDQTESNPGHWTDNDRKINHRDDDRGQLGPIAKML